ncbi:uncharacterized, partial [Tachysurus ichikawai]
FLCHVNCTASDLKVFRWVITPLRTSLVLSGKRRGLKTAQWIRKDDVHHSHGHFAMYHLAAFKKEQANCFLS